MTIKDLARRLGVSYSTVSKSLNHDPHISDRTRQRVLEEAERCGFVLNANARNLASRHTGKIGILFSNNFNRSEYRWFFGQLEMYATRAIEELGYDYDIQPHKNIRGESNLLKMVSGGQVDGVVIFSRDITKAEYLQLENRKFPCTYVYYNPSFLTDRHPDLFMDDDEQGGYLATEHLIAKGHQKILTIRSDDSAMRMYEARTQGYIQAMHAHGLTPAVLEMPMTFPAARNLLKERFGFIKDFSALFIQQDQPALSMIQELERKYGVRVPKDISVIGYNNIQLIHDLDIPLTTVADPMEDVIRSAVKACICHVTGKPEDEIRLRLPRLIERETVQLKDTF